MSATDWRSDFVELINGYRDEIVRLQTEKFDLETIISDIAGVILNKCPDMINKSSLKDVIFDIISDYDRIRSELNEIKKKGALTVQVKD